MESPYPESSSSPGDGHIIAKPLPAGGTGLESMTYQYPLKLISPSPTINDKSALVFLLSYGGGLVGGDKVNLSVHIKERARLSVATQGHTKIFKSPSPHVLTSQTLDVHIKDGAALCLLPDPVQPFADSYYSQVQVFRCTPASSLCFLDWVTQGRSARGEDWSFGSWAGRNEVWLEDGLKKEKARLLVRDTVKLSAQSSLEMGSPLRETMHKMGIFGTLILHGTLTNTLGEFFMAEFAALPRIGSRDFRSEEARAKDEEGLSGHEKWRMRRIDSEKNNGVLWSAAQVRGCTVIKFGAKTVETGRDWVGSMLVREGSVAAQFGDQALLCVRP